MHWFFKFSKKTHITGGYFSAQGSSFCAYLVVRFSEKLVLNVDSFTRKTVLCVFQSLKTFQTFRRLSVLMVLYIGQKIFRSRFKGFKEQTANFNNLQLATRFA
jgi:hypothetical protein